MVPLGTPRHRGSANRWLAIAAVVLWAAAAALAWLYFLHDPANDSATAHESYVAASNPWLASTTSTTEAPAITTTEAPTTTTTTLPPSLTVAAGGDVLGDRGVGAFMDENGGAPLFAEVKPFFESADLAFVNSEGPISDTGTRATWKEYTFRARPALVDGLVSAGIDLVSLANNHSVDYGTKALLDTFVRLDDVGISYAGAGADAAAASAPAFRATPAGIVAVLAFTDIIPGGFTATSDTPGVNATTPDREKLLAAVSAANENADFVIVSFHWGTEYQSRANQDQRKLAHQVVDAGADLVLGHHPHVIQGLELYRNRLIAYSLGDFVWDHYSRETGETFILLVTVPRQGPPSAEIVPVYLDDSTGVPAPVTGDDAASILERLASLSADLGMEITISEDRAFLEPTPASTP